MRKVQTYKVNRPLIHQAGSSYKTCQFYLKNEPDLYIILGERIFPLHSAKMNESIYISTQLQKKITVLFIPFPFQIQGFEKVINYLYSCQFSFQRNLQVQKLYQIAKQLGISSLITFFHKDIQFTFEQYCFFNLYKLAKENGLTWLLNRCQKQLLTLQFEQINIHRMGFLQLNQNLFSQIIRNHQKLKTSKVIKGLNYKDIIQVIQDYQYYNKCEIQINQLLKLSNYQFEFEQVNSTNRPKLRRTRTFLERSVGNILKQPKMNYSHNELSLLSSINKIKQVLILKDIIQKDLQSSKQMMKQISQIKQWLQKLETVESPMISIDELEDKIKKVSKWCGSSDDNFLKPAIPDEKAVQMSYLTVESCDQMDIRQGNGKIGHSQQTTNPSQSQQKQSKSYQKIPQISRNFSP